MTKSVFFIFIFLGSACTFSIARADHHGVHHHGPNGGVLISLDDDKRYVELVVRDDQVVTARLFDNEKEPLKNVLGFLTLTFTEPDGEKEDYKIEANEENGEKVFQKTSGHVVHHIVRDPIVVSIQQKGKT